MKKVVKSVVVHLMVFAFLAVGAHAYDYTATIRCRTASISQKLKANHKVSKEDQEFFTNLCKELLEAYFYEVGVEMSRYPDTEIYLAYDYSEEHDTLTGFDLYIYIPKFKTTKVLNYIGVDDEVYKIGENAYAGYMIVYDPSKELTLAKGKF